MKSKTQTIPQTEKKFKLRSASELTETVQCRIPEVVAALSASRPQLLKLYRPTKPVPAEDVIHLVNIIRVLLETNQELKLHVDHLERHHKNVTEMITQLTEDQRTRTSVINQAIRDYKGVISPDNHVFDED
jgi:hypothetical protein